MKTNLCFISFIAIKSSFLCIHGYLNNGKCFIKYTSKKMSWNIFFRCRNEWIKKMNIWVLSKSKYLKWLKTVPEFALQNKGLAKHSMIPHHPLPNYMHTWLSLITIHWKSVPSKKIYIQKAVFVSSRNNISEAHLRTAIAPQLYMYFQECNGRQPNNLANSVTVQNHAISHPFILYICGVV